ncbi:MAG: M23 family metallopeptidase [Longicatena caecimuris]|uniref:M23 family metallopeptidase n=1 Tax=Longicatena caecimuris TaxID=1796635 RepID=UPI0039929EDE
MSDLNDVRKRIRKRRGTQATEKEHSFSLFRLFYHTVMLAMGICVVVLALMLNAKLKLIEMPAYIQNFKLDSLTQWIPFDNWFSLKEEAVSAAPAYTPIKDNQYQNGTNSAYAVFNGVVLHVQRSDSRECSVSLKQDNGVVTTYGHLKEVNVKADERILKGKMLGTYENHITIDFLKDNKEISYEKGLAENSV